MTDLEVAYLILSLFSYSEKDILGGWQYTYLTNVCEFLTLLACDIVLVKEMLTEITEWGF